MHGKTSIISALIGNILVTFFKAIVFFITGSASMFAESIHSFADTLNQSLLFVGVIRSKKPADDVHGYGYGIERFFWSLISACGILFIGAGISVYHSIDSLVLKGSETGLNFNILSIVVLLVSLVVEGATFLIALRELTKGKKFSKELFEEADPVLLAVVYEDGAAVLGVIVALVAQSITYLTGNIAYDAYGGIFVGLILGILAIILIRKNYHYIIGKALDEKTKEEIIKFMEEDPCVEQVVEFKSVALDVGKFRIYATVEWNGSPLYESNDLRKDFDDIKDDFTNFTKLMFRLLDRIPRLVGNRIDVIEKHIKERFPQITYVDIEIN